MLQKKAKLPKSSAWCGNAGPPPGRLMLPSGPRVPLFDMARLARAVHLDAHLEAPGRWSVTGGAASHVVTVRPEGASCDCSDLRAPGGYCKHRLAVALVRGVPVVVRALRHLVPVPQRRRSRAA